LGSRKPLLEETTVSDDEHESVPQEQPPAQQQESPFAVPPLEEIGKSYDPPGETRDDG
jgi:hypothetical protein